MTHGLRRNLVFLLYQPEQAIIKIMFHHEKYCHLHKETYYMPTNCVKIPTMSNNVNCKVEYETTLEYNQQPCPRIEVLWGSPILQRSNNSSTDGNSDEREEMHCPWRLTQWYWEHHPYRDLVSKLEIYSTKNNSHKEIKYKIQKSLFELHTFHQRDIRLLKSNSE